MTTTDRKALLANTDVRPKEFVHFVIKTNRFEEQIDFYLNFLNGWTVFKSDDAAFLTYDNEHHRLAIANGRGQLPEANPRAVGLEHLSYAYHTLGDLLANYLRLKEVGIHPYWCINHGPTTSLYYRDLDGNQIETQVDNFDTVSQLIAYFGTDEYRENFLGVQFDPDTLVELYRNGTPEKELLRRGVAPRAPGTEYVFDL